MSSANQISPPSAAVAVHVGEEARWYAIHTRCRHEKRVDTRLQQYGLATFLPLVKEIHHWSDRRQEVDVPLFSCYTFVHVNLAWNVQKQVLQTPGVLAFVGCETGALPIPDHEIAQVQRVVAERLSLSPYPFLKVGQRIRVRGGAMDGLEGILTSHKGASTLVISVAAIHRSIALSVNGYDFEPA